MAFRADRAGRPGRHPVQVSHPLGSEPKTYPELPEGELDRIVVGAYITTIE